MCTVGQLAGGGFVAVAVAISDMWKVGQVEKIYKKRNTDVLVSALLSAHVKRCSASHMWDFLYPF